jgi:DNA-binding transcriptional MocR family regulator
LLKAEFLDRRHYIVPSLRLGYLVVPESLVAAFTRSNRLRHLGHATLKQRVIADFMAAGYFARHLKRMRALYAARRRALADGLSAVFGDRITVDLRPGGMHLIARFARRVSDVKLAQLAQAGGLSVRGSVAPCDDACVRTRLAVGVHQHRRGGRAPHLPPAASNDRKVVGQ